MVFGKLVGCPWWAGLLASCFALLPNNEATKTIMASDDKLKVRRFGSAGKACGITTTNMVCVSRVRGEQYCCSLPPSLLARCFEGLLIPGFPGRFFVSRVSAALNLIIWVCFRRAFVSWVSAGATWYYGFSSGLRLSLGFARERVSNPHAELARASTSTPGCNHSRHTQDVRNGFL